MGCSPHKRAIQITRLPRKFSSSGRDSCQRGHGHGVGRGRTPGEISDLMTGLGFDNYVAAGSYCSGLNRPLYSLQLKRHRNRTAETDRVQFVLVYVGRGHC